MVFSKRLSLFDVFLDPKSVYTYILQDLRKKICLRPCFMAGVIRSNDHPAFRFNQVRRYSRGEIWPESCWQKGSSSRWKGFAVPMGKGLQYDESTSIAFLSGYIPGSFWQVQDRYVSKATMNPLILNDGWMVEEKRTEKIKSGSLTHRIHVRYL